MRKALDYVLTQKELYWLDHILPDVARMKNEDHGVIIEDDIIADDDQEVLRYKAKMGLRNSMDALEEGEGNDTDANENTQVSMVHLGRN